VYTKKDQFQEKFTAEEGSPPGLWSNFGLGKLLKEDDWSDSNEVRKTSRC